MNISTPPGLSDTTLGLIAVVAGVILSLFKDDLERLIPASGATHDARMRQITAGVSVLLVMLSALSSGALSWGNWMGYLASALVTFGTATGTYHTMTSAGAAGAARSAISALVNSSASLATATPGAPEAPSVYNDGASAWTPPAGIFNAASAPAIVTITTPASNPADLAQADTAPTLQAVSGLADPAPDGGTDNGATAEVPALTVKARTVMAAHSPRRQRLPKAQVPAEPAPASDPASVLADSPAMPSTPLAPAADQAAEAAPEAAQAAEAQPVAAEAAPEAGQG